MSHEENRKKGSNPCSQEAYMLPFGLMSCIVLDLKMFICGLLLQNKRHISFSIWKLVLKGSAGRVQKFLLVYLQDQSPVGDLVTVDALSSICINDQRSRK